MTRVLLLAWRYTCYHRLKTAILVAGLTLTFVLPLTAHLLIEVYGKSLMARAKTTPLVVGAPGNRFDLVLQALYFRAGQLPTIRMSDVEALRANEWGTPIPLDLRFTARGYPLVGTTLTYFDFRGLATERGTLPLRLGQCVLGARVAHDLNLDPGDALFSDQQSIYDITQTYPLKMHVAGVLQETGSPDDEAVFVDLKTAWVIAGLAHGHQDVTRTDDENVILRRDEGEVVTNAAIVEYNEITPENIRSFHVHAQPKEIPLSAILVIPASAKGRTILKAQYAATEAGPQMLVPREVVADLLSLVFRVQRFFDATFGLVLLTTVLFLFLVVLLSLRLRQRERETMFKLGCSRGMMILLQVAELGIVLLISLVLTAALASSVVAAAPRLGRLLQS